MTTRINRRSFLGAAGLSAAATLGLESPRLDDDPLGLLRAMA
jgi:hypothetical protein